MDKAQPPVAKKPFYRNDPLTSIILVLAVFFTSQVIAGVLLSVYPSIKNMTATQASDWLTSSVYVQFFYISITSFFAVWFTFGLLKRSRVALSRIGVFKPKLRDIAYALSGYGVYFVSYIIIILIASRFSGLIDVDQPQQIGFDSAAGYQLIFVFVSLVILPPIAEEVMFRGFLFTSFRQKYRFRFTALFTSILFGIAHLQFGSGAPLLWVAAIDTFVLSMVLCYLREKSGSLWPPILLHAIKNGVAFFAFFYAKF